MLAENIVQVFSFEDNIRGPLFGAVGPLQFEVLQYRLKSEYGAESTLEMMPWTLMRWTRDQPDPKRLQEFSPYGGQVGRDDRGRAVIFFPSKWSLERFCEEHPGLELMDTQEVSLPDEKTANETPG